MHPKDCSRDANVRRPQTRAIGPGPFRFAAQLGGSDPVDCGSQSAPGPTQEGGQANNKAPVTPAPIAAPKTVSKAEWWPLRTRAQAVRGTNKNKRAAFSPYIQVAAAATPALPAECTLTFHQRLSTAMMARTTAATKTIARARGKG